LTEIHSNSDTAAMSTTDTYLYLFLCFILVVFYIVFYIVYQPQCSSLNIFSIHPETVQTAGCYCIIYHKRLL